MEICAVCRYRHPDKPIILSEKRVNKLKTKLGGEFKNEYTHVSPTSNPSPPGKARAGESHRPSALAHLTDSELYMLRAILSRAHRRGVDEEEDL